MRSRIALALLPAIAVSMMSLPGNAGQESYEREYLVGSTPGLAFRFHPGTTNVGDTNPADEDPTGLTKGTPLDQAPLEGTPADDRLLEGTPADVNLGGVLFEAGTFDGKPIKLKVEDASDFPVAWSACQKVGPTEGVCGIDGEDVSQGGCGTPKGGEFLAGFRGDLDIGVWIIISDSAGTFAGGPCDGPATTGTVTLITKT